MRKSLGYGLAGGLACILALLSWGVQAQQANPYADAIQAVRPSIVGVGVTVPTANPPFRLQGTGFVVGDGQWIVTNAHVIPQVLESEKREELVVLTFARDPVDQSLKISRHPAVVRQLDRERDIAILRIQAAPLPALKLHSENTLLPEGSMVAFSGYALGHSLGISLITHRGMISAVTPAVLAVPDSRGLNANGVRAIRGTPFRIYQLDATAFPGQSGSPIYDPVTREVVAVITGGLVKGNREMALSNPSGITYAIPVQYVREALQRAGQ